MSKNLMSSPPSLGRRLASMFYEILLLLGVLSVTFILPHILLGVLAQRSVMPAIVQLHFFLVLMAYFCWFWLHGGQTLAMRTWKVRIVSTIGQTPLSKQQAVVRYIAAWPSILLFGLGIIWMFFDRDRQFLHDRLAGTEITWAE